MVEKKRIYSMYLHTPLQTSMCKRWLRKALLAFGALALSPTRKNFPDLPNYALCIWIEGSKVGNDGKNNVGTWLGKDVRLHIYLNGAHARPPFFSYWS